MKIINGLQGWLLARRLSKVKIRSTSGEHVTQARSISKANADYWFWACLAVTVLSQVVAWNLGEQAIRSWTQPRVYEVKGGLQKAALGEIEYAQAGEILRGLIPHDDSGQSLLTVQVSASGITLAGATPAAYEAFIFALWQLPGLLPNATWEIDEICMGAGCTGGAVMAKAHAQKITIVMDSN